MDPPHLIRHHHTYYTNHSYNIMSNDNNTKLVNPKQKKSAKQTSPNELKEKESMMLSGTLIRAETIPLCITISLPKSKGLQKHETPRLFTLENPSIPGKTQESKDLNRTERRFLKNITPDNTLSLLTRQSHAPIVHMPDLTEIPFDQIPAGSKVSLQINNITYASGRSKLYVPAIQVIKTPSEPETPANQ